MAHDFNAKSRLVAKILREVLKAHEPFETLADLTDVLKGRLSAVHVQTMPHDITAAYAMVRPALKVRK